jgi:2-oxoglutarate ferredoxin oxidoreductase subunit alpha
MIRELPKVGGIAIQAEDEIASMGLCIGAALTGRRVMTATSGPGISLYSENIGLAIMGEVPMVIVNVQRMGPATGSATTSALGDIQFLRWGTSGGYPVIVLCPASVSDCFTLTCRAFDLAERFRTPVFLATDKETALTRSTVDKQTLEKIAVRQREYAPTDKPFIPYKVNDLSDVPPISYYGGPHLLRFTTSSHDEKGYLTKDPKHLEHLNRHLTAKINAHVNEISFVKRDLEEGAEILIVSYGVTYSAAKSAVQKARRTGERLSLLNLYSLWPVPEREIRSALKGIKKIIIPELNMGQYQRELERLTRNNQEVIGIHRVDGNLITPNQILENCY